MVDLTPDAIHWSDEVTLREFAESFDGPRLVRLRCETPSGESSRAVVELGTEVDTDGLFLAYSRRLRTKVYGQPLVREGGTTEYVVSGSMLEIPKDYPGWFSVIPDGGGELQPYVSIKQVANSNCRHFLTVSTLVGFLTSTGADDNICLIAEKKVYPGEVLHVTGVASRKWKVKTGAKPSIPPETLLLKCVNRAKREISFPLAHPGRFYAIAGPRAEGDNSNRKTDCVYTISDIADGFQLPLNVSLVFGWTPWLQGGRTFGGQLRLQGVDRPETLVTYNFVRNKDIFVELPVRLNVKVRQASDSSQYESSAAYKAALATCGKRTFPFVSSIKSALLVRYATRLGSAQGEPTENGTGERSENGMGETTGEEETNSTKRSGFLPMAINMADFNPLRLFPPLDYETAPDIGALSFTDTVNKLDQEATENGFDFSFHFSVPSGYKLSKDTCGRHSMKPSKVDHETPPLDRKRDLRESRDKEVRSREAVC